MNSISIFFIKNFRKTKGDMTHKMFIYILFYTVCVNVLLVYIYCPLKITRHTAITVKK